MTPRIKEHTCRLCNGTGFPKSMQPADPGRKIYPMKCDVCRGKGKIVEIE
jgi:DnaJ-class molecular chaperone